MTGKAERTVRVWDLPTRLFHWLLALSVGGAIITANIGGNLMEWHGKLGILILGLVAFRLVWGVAGSTYALFATFLPGPNDIFAYLKGEWRGLGHNPLGALSVLALLGMLGLMAATGLFANDDIAFEGPLISLIGKDFSDRLTTIHHLASTGLYGLIGLHIVAILFYAVFKKDNLVKPMVTGLKEIEGQADAFKPAAGGSLAGLLLALALACASIWAASGAWLSEPPPPVTNSSDW